MFSIGDKVSCPLHGAGIVENFITKDAPVPNTQFYVIRLAGMGMKITIPMSAAGNGGLRYITDAGCAKGLMDDFAAIEYDFEHNWTKRYRDNLELLKTGDLYEAAKVFKALAGRNKLKGLSAGERKMLQTAKQYVVSELTLSLDMEKEQVENYLYDNLGVTQDELA